MPPPGSPYPRLVPEPPPGDRLPPQNLDAERGVLGGVLLDNEVLHDVIGLLKVEDFYRDSHQVIYRHIRELYDAGKPVDFLILSEELTRKGEYEKVGGLEALVQIRDSVPHAANSRYYAQIVREKATSRNLIEAAHEILREGYSNTLTAEELLEGAEQRVFAIAEEQVTGETVELSDIMSQAMDRIALRSESGHAVNGVGTGYFELDDMTSGFQPGQLIIVAARPSMGKTAFALNICEHVAVSNRQGVLFVSLEMGNLEIAERLLCARARVDGHKLRSGQNLGTREMTLLGKGYEELNRSPLFIDDTPTRNMLQITANARRLKRRRDLSMVVVDYIQLVDSDESRDSRQEQIAKISRRLKTLARDLSVPVIALSQLNRGVENREDKRPKLSDLRESGAIEQDADIVLMLHRPEYYDQNDQPGIAELICNKNRNGATGTVKLTFLKNFMRFENLAAIHDPIGGGAF